MEIAIISGKGGTGKSSLTAAFASIETEVVLADCDVDAANLFLLFNPQHETVSTFDGSLKASINPEKCMQCGLCATHCNFEAIRYKNHKYTVNKTFCEGCRLCVRVCPFNAINMEPGKKSRLYTGAFRYGRMVYGRLAPAEENSGKLVSRVREAAKNNATGHSLPIILLDGPPGIGCTAISTITGVDRVVIVTEPTLSGIHDLKRATEMVKKFNARVYTVINKSDLNADITKEIITFCAEAEIEVAGVLPFEPEMIRALVNRKTIIEYKPELPISHELRRIWAIVKQS